MSKSTADSIRIVSTNAALTPHFSEKARRDLGGVISRFQTKHRGASIEIVPTHGHGIICKVDLVDAKGKSQHVERRERSMTAALDASLAEMSRTLSAVQATTIRGGVHRPPYLNTKQGRGRHGPGH